MTDPVLAAKGWRTNAEMIAEVSRLGYFDGPVFDATYGEGHFWDEYRPKVLFTNDLYKSATFHIDYRDLSVLGERRYDTVMFDPDYKLTGTPSTPEMDYRYGTDKPKRWQDRMDDILRGTASCFYVCNKFLLVKCMDQVVSGHIRWQTDEITDVVKGLGGVKVDRFDYLHSPREQPPGRTQKHAARCYSTLLCFRKPARLAVRPPEPIRSIPDAAVRP